MVKFSFIVFNIHVLWRYTYYKGIMGIIYLGIIEKIKNLNSYSVLSEIWIAP